MKPVAIFRHSRTEGPGHFATFLEAHGIAWRLIDVNVTSFSPHQAVDYSGIALMGGSMSVNDRLPWIEPECALIRNAIAQGIPVLGHCLGGQLMSRALGGTVSRNPVKEIGWGRIDFLPGATSASWLGPMAERAAIDVFHWHGETFSIPPGATRIAASAFCENQVFALGPHLGMQCHVEMTPAMIASWCESWHEEIPASGARPASVQTPQEMIADIATKLPDMRELACQLYAQWISGLKR